MFCSPSEIMPIEAMNLTRQVRTFPTIAEGTDEGIRDMSEQYIQVQHVQERQQGLLGGGKPFTLAQEIPGGGKSLRTAISRV